jgi:hypothetical protein
MESAMKFQLLIAAVLISSAASAQHESPYAGQQHNEIKALSAQEVNSLLAGHGMGYARAAELNGYPGPMHVIELASELGLTADQLRASQALMNEHRARAQELGAELIVAERELDALFAQRKAEASAVATLTQRIGALQSRLRAEHLNTHLQQTALLNAEQVRRYGEKRGYASGSGNHSHRVHK